MMGGTSIQTCFLYTHDAMLKFLSLRKTTFLTNMLSFSIMPEIKKNQKKIKFFENHTKKFDPSEGLHFRRPF